MDLVLSSGLIMTLNDLIAVSGKNHIALVSALNIPKLVTFLCRISSPKSQQPSVAPGNKCIIY